MHSFGPVNPNCMATCPAAAFGISIGTMNGDRKSTRLNSSHSQISYAVFCLKKKKKQNIVKYAYSFLLTGVIDVAKIESAIAPDLNNHNVVIVPAYSFSVALLRPTLTLLKC